MKKLRDANRKGGSSGGSRSSGDTIPNSEKLSMRSSGDTIPNSETLSMVSPELYLFTGLLHSSPTSIIMEMKPIACVVPLMTMIWAMFFGACSGGLGIFLSRTHRKHRQ